MYRIGLVFSTCALLMLASFSFGSGLTVPVQLFGSLFLIAILGIPHGAIDHVIFMKTRPVKPVYFYAFYLGLMAVYLFTWLAFPQWSLAVFLLLSAYHFGQSQFSDIHFMTKVSGNLLYFFWGLSILSGLVIYNMDEITTLMSSANVKAEAFEIMEEYNFFTTLLIGSSIITHGLFTWSALAKDMPFKRLLFEILLFWLIHFTFYYLPLMVGFTLYFAAMHSLKVLTEEYTYLKTTTPSFNFTRFLAMLLPYTALSLTVGGIIIGLAFFGLIQASSLLISLMLIALLTLPHSVVMHVFYAKLYSKPEEEFV